MQKKILNVILVSLLTIFFNLQIAHASSNKFITQKKQIELLKKYSPSVVIVNFWFKYNNGEIPDFARNLIKNKKPYQLPGFFITKKEILIPDIIYNSRFFDKVTVDFKGKQYVASKQSYMKNYDAAIYELKNKIPKAFPLDFSTKDKVGKLMIEYKRMSGEFELEIEPFSPSLCLDSQGQVFESYEIPKILLNKSGEAITLLMRDKEYLNKKRVYSPLKWEKVYNAQLQKRFSLLEKKLADTIFQTTLTFRSPKMPVSLNQETITFGEGATTKTEKNCLSIAIGKNRIVILERLVPSVTARLKDIAIRLADGKTINAKFEKTVSSWGAFTATTQKPFGTIMAFSKEPIGNNQDKLYLSAQIRIQGEKKTIYMQRNRIGNYYRGFNNKLYPVFDSNERDTFVFDSSNNLLALPLSRRNKISDDWDSWGGNGRNNVILSSASFLEKSLGDNSKNYDPNNIPLLEKNENRLAWMGVVLQGMTPNLAKVNNVSQYTSNGKTGAIVSYVYKNSPAAKAGIRPGVILLWLNVEGQEKPTMIKVDEGYGHQPFPWDQYDMIPSTYLMNLPLPWKSVKNTLSAKLTDIGFDKKYKVTFYDNGKVFQKSFVVEKMPKYYGSAESYYSKALGMNVKNLTFEVRRYFQLDENAPGVIVSRVKSGFPAEISGIKNYEIITKIDGKIINNISDFKDNIADKTQLKFNITIMVKQRVIKINL